MRERRRASLDRHSTVLARLSRRGQIDDSECQMNI
jgi:hypothetical protein